MNLVVLATLAAVAVAAPSGYDDTYKVVEVITDERNQDDQGKYVVDVETTNGISLAQSGSPIGPEGTVIKAGQYSYTAPDGTLVEVKYIANENGFHPQSDVLPVPPEFPHPIPQFVLDQIAFAAAEDAARARGDHSSSYEEPSSGYSS